MRRRTTSLPLIDHLPWSRAVGAYVMQSSHVRKWQLEDQVRELVARPAGPAYLVGNAELRYGGVCQHVVGEVIVSEYPQRCV